MEELLTQGDSFNEHCEGQVDLMNENKWTVLSCIIFKTATCY